MCSQSQKQYSKNFVFLLLWTDIPSCPPRSPTWTEIDANNAFSGPIDGRRKTPCRSDREFPWVGWVLRLPTDLSTRAARSPTHHMRWAVRTTSTDARNRPALYKARLWGIPITLRAASPAECGTADCF